MHSEVPTPELKTGLRSSVHGSTGERRKQSSGPSAGEWVRKRWAMSTMIISEQVYNRTLLNMCTTGSY